MNSTDLYSIKRDSQTLGCLRLCSMDWKSLLNADTKHNTGKLFTKAKIDLTYKTK